MLKYKLQTKYLETDRELGDLENLVNKELEEFFALGLEVATIGHPKREVGSWFVQIVYKVYDDEENKFNK